MSSPNSFSNGNIDNRQIFSLSDILGGLESVVRERFPYYVWIKADISKLNIYKYSGHAYPELVEKKDGQIVAQTKAIIWKNDLQRINSKFIKVVGEPLKDGISIVCQAKLTFHTLYGLSLIIYDIDPQTTLGQLEKEKRITIEKLKEEGLFSLNKTISLPILPQRIAVISVETSKGYSDFMQVISGVENKYKIFTYLFRSLLQGDGAVEQLIDALNTIESVKEYFDTVVIIRGGGGEIGLNCYNDYNLCAKIARFPLPILTGVGHSTNLTVSEMISYQNFITPTALGEFVVKRFVDFDTAIISMKDKIIDISSNIIKEEKKALSYTKNMIVANGKSIIQSHKIIIDSKYIEIHVRRMLHSENYLLNHSISIIKILVSNILKTNYERIDNNLKYIDASNPSHILKQGYTITTHNGRIIDENNSVQKGDEIVTQTFNGKIVSKVK